MASGSGSHRPRRGPLLQSATGVAVTHPTRPQPPPQAVLLEMWSGYVVSRALSVVAELAIADHLVERPKTDAELAAATGANQDALHRVLRMLAARGVFAEEESGRFGSTPLSECLRSGVPG